jgi:hypothetical protein
MPEEMHKKKTLQEIHHTKLWKLDETKITERWMDNIASMIIFREGEEIIYVYHFFTFPVVQ